MVIKPHPKQGAGLKRAFNFSNYMLDPVGRAAVPVQILGPDRRVFDAAGEGYAPTTVNPITTFDIGFFELLDLPLAKLIIREIRDEFAVGLDPVDVLELAGLHATTDEEDDLSSDMHLGLVNKLITTGVQWNPYNEKSHRGWLTALTETINYRYNLASAKDPSCQRLVSYPNDRYDPQHVEELKLSLSEAVKQRHATKPFQTKGDFLGFVRNSKGVTRVVDRKSCVDISFEGCAVRMLGLLASNSYFEGKVRVRKKREEYELDLKEARERRRKEQQALYDSRPKHNMLSWARIYYPQIDAEFKLERELEIFSLVEVESVIRHIIKNQFDLNLDGKTADGAPIGRYLEFNDGRWNVRQGIMLRSENPKDLQSALMDLKDALSAIEQITLEKDVATPSQPSGRQ